MSLTKKIDFALIIGVKNANPNGDPLNGNRPRTDFEGNGEITDVCLKRKIRDRLQEDGESIFVQSDEKKNDGMTSLKNRAYDENVGLGKKAFETKKGENLESKREATAKLACDTGWRGDSSANLAALAQSLLVQPDRPNVTVAGPASITQKLGMPVPSRCTRTRCATAIRRSSVSRRRRPHRRMVCGSASGAPSS